MGEVVNLRRVRKERAKAEAQARARANRAKHGRSKPEKQASGKIASLEESRLKAHQREVDETDPAK
jgi:hypothetical protein